MLGDDLSYLLEVLNIRDGDSEDQFDERLKLEAKELGLDVNEGQTDTQSVHSGYSRRSESLDSRASYSTGLTSHFSEPSRGDLPSRQGRLSHPLSFRDYDAFLARGTPNGRHSVSFSPSATPEGSVFSLPLSHPVSSSPMRHFRRIRDRLQQRNDSHTSLVDGCPHCPQDAPSQRRAVHTLPCGHRLCTKALRNTINSATESHRGSVPSCCSKPIPGSLVEQVMTQEEQNALLEKLEQWDEAAPSIESSRRGSTATQNFPTVLSDRSEQTSSEFERQKEFSTTAHDELERITELPEYTTLLSTQATQRDRFLHWTAAQRMSLTASHSDQRKNILTTHESAAEDLAEHHADALAEAEDKQIVAEAALREVHLIEKFSAETCLRHREAYCSGMLSNGEAHGRNITDVDLERLEIARREKEMIQGRHFSAINVLRGEQGRRIKLRKQRQDRELQELARQQRREELEFERKCSAEVSKLEGGLAEKKRKLEWRWELQMALLAKKLWQPEGGMEENFRLPTAKWTGSEPGRLVSASAELIVDEAIEMESQAAAREFKVG